MRMPSGLHAGASFCVPSNASRVNVSRAMSQTDVLAVDLRRDSSAVRRETGPVVLARGRGERLLGPVTRHPDQIAVGTGRSGDVDERARATSVETSGDGRSLQRERRAARPDRAARPCRRSRSRRSRSSLGSARATPSAPSARSRTQNRSTACTLPSGTRARVDLRGVDLEPAGRDRGGDRREQARADRPPRTHSPRVPRPAACDASAVTTHSSATSAWRDGTSGTPIVAAARAAARPGRARRSPPACSRAGSAPASCRGTRAGTCGSSAARRSSARAPARARARRRVGVRPAVAAREQRVGREEQLVEHARLPRRSSRSGWWWTGPRP